MQNIDSKAESQTLFDSIKEEGIKDAQLLSDKEKTPREKKKERAQNQLSKVGLTTEQRSENFAKSLDYFNRIPPYLFPDGAMSYIQSAMAIVFPTNLRTSEGLMNVVKEDLGTEMQNADIMQQLKTALTRKLDEGEKESDRKIEISRILEIPASNEDIKQELEKMYPSQMDTFPVDEDCWRFYLGLPQKHNTLAVSDYQPTTAKDRGTYYYKINDFDKQNLLDDYFLIIKGGYLKDKMREEIPGKKDTYIMKFAYPYFKDKSKVFDPLHAFTISLGEDEKGSYISYYDIYDLNGYDWSVSGKPYELYDRIYYNPKTKKVIE